MFDNNFGKCGPIFKILSQLNHKKILYVYTRKISSSHAIDCEIRKSKNVAKFSRWTWQSLTKI